MNHHFSVFQRLLVDYFSQELMLYLLIIQVGLAMYIVMERLKPEQPDQGNKILPRLLGLVSILWH